jgi:hypothetical protein
MDFPKASEEILPEVYELLDDQAERAERVLRRHFETVDRGEAEVIKWGEATSKDFAEAMYADPPVMIEFFKKISGLPSREFDRVYGIGDLERMKGWTRKDLRETERGQTFAKAMDEVLPDEMFLDTAMYTFYQMAENDQRRHVRSNYENVVLEELKKAGVPAKKDESIEGKPDIAIPEAEPYDVLGEVRALHSKDFKKRVKNFDSEARSAKEAFPEARFVVFAKFPPHQIEKEGEYLRETIKQVNDHIDAVYFHDEINEFVEQVEKWGVDRDATTQETLNE